MSVPLDVIDVVALVLSGVTVAGVLQCLAGLGVLTRFRHRRLAEPAVLPG